MFLLPFRPRLVAMMVRLTATSHRLSRHLQHSILHIIAKRPRLFKASLLHSVFIVPVL